MPDTHEQPPAKSAYELDFTVSIAETSSSNLAPVTSFTTLLSLRILNVGTTLIPNSFARDCDTSNMMRLKRDKLRERKVRVLADLVILVAVKLHEYNIKVLLRQFLKFRGHHLARPAPSSVSE